MLKRTMQYILVAAVVILGSTSSFAYELQDFTKGMDIPEVVATINGVELKSKVIKFQFNRAMRDKPGQMSAADKKKFAQMLIDNELVRELIYQEGKKNNQNIPEKDINAELEKMKSAFGYESEEKLMEALKEREIDLDELRRTIEVDLVAKKLLDQNVRGKISVTDKQVEKYYEENTAQFFRPDSFKAQHIFIPHIPIELQKSTNPSELMKRKEELSKKAEQEIKEVYKKIGPNVDFGELAKKYSKDEGSAQNGGDLDFMYKGVFDPEFDAAVSKLKIGEISDVVKTGFGFHIIKLNETRPPEQAPFEDVKGSIQKHLFMEEANLKVQDYIDSLRKKADIKLLY